MIECEEELETESIFLSFETVSSISSTVEEAFGVEVEPFTGSAMAAVDTNSLGVGVTSPLVNDLIKLSNLSSAVDEVTDG